MARYTQPRKSGLRRIPFLLIAVGLVAFTAAQVGARWKHPSESAPFPALSPSAQAEMAAHLSARDAEIMRKAESRLKADPSDLEAELLKGLLYFKTGRLDAAMAVMEELTRRAPNFHLAHLIRGDLILFQIKGADDIDRSPVLKSLAVGSAEQLSRLRSEATARLQGYLTLVDGQRVPASLLLLDSGIPFAFLVDKTQHRLYIYENGGDAPPRLVADYYCVIGKMPGNKEVRGDQRTPEGVYIMTRRIPDELLPERYGMEAYPLDYPNDFDHRLGKTGDGIWLHGTDKGFYSRPPLDSDGCVVLSNHDLQRVARFIQTGRTPMVIADRLDWISPEAWIERRRELVSQVDNWRRDWESSQVERYLSHYAPDFLGDGCDLPQWQERKRRIAQGKTYQQVKVSGLSLFAYPRGASGGREMAVANFRQEYRSNNFTSDMAKRLYLVRHGGSWRIWSEGGRETVSREQRKAS